MKAILVVLSLLLPCFCVGQESGSGVELPRNAEIPIVIDPGEAYNISISQEEVRSTVEKVFRNHGLEPALFRKDYFLLIQLDTVYCSGGNPLVCLELQFKRSVLYKIRGKEFSVVATTYSDRFCGGVSAWPDRAILNELQDLVRRFSVKVVESWQ